MTDKVGYENPGQHPNAPDRVYASGDQAQPVDPYSDPYEYARSLTHTGSTDSDYGTTAPPPGTQQTQQTQQTPPPAPRALDTLTPDELSTLLGSDGYAPGYDSNDKGSFDRNYDAYLNSLSPEQLLKRYGNTQTKQHMTAADKANYQAYNSFNSLFGRLPNKNELAQIIPAFQGPNGAMNGNAYLASLQQLYKSNPAADPNSKQNNQNPTDVGSAVAQQFKSILGRDPTQDELEHFSQAVQTGQTDTYGLASFLKQMPEYTNAQDQQFRQGLNSELEGYDTKEFNRQKEGIMADYAKRGMAPGSSSSLDYALTDLMGNIASNRSAYLSQLSAGQYGGNKDLAIGNYQNSLNQLYGQSQGQRQNQNAYTQQLLNQGFQGADYSSQMKDYMNFMGNQPQSKGMNPLAGAMQGAAAGSAAGPWGALIGAGAGVGAAYLNR